MFLTGVMLVLCVVLAIIILVPFASVLWDIVTEDILELDNDFE